MKTTGQNTNTIKSNNIRLLLNCIKHKPQSRAEISKTTGLSKSAVTTIIKQLIDEGIVYEVGAETTQMGRHPITLDIVKNYKYAIGVLLHRKRVGVCVTNLKLETIAEAFCNIENFTSPESALDWAYTTAMKLMKDNGINTSDCIGISITAPGPLDYKSGMILNPPNFPLFWNFNAADYMKSKTDYPVYLNNSPVVMAVYEQFRRSDDIGDYIYISVDHGVGSAIVREGSIYRGIAGYSGEIGHTTVDINGELCSCGNRGCLECYITEKALINRFGIESYSATAEKASEGDSASLKVVDYVAELLAGGIINAVNLMDLKTVIIGGELNHHHEILFEKIQNLINKRSIISKAHEVKVFPSLLQKGEISHTASMAVQRFLDQKANT